MGTEKYLEVVKQNFTVKILSMPLGPCSTSIFPTITLFICSSNMVIQWSKTFCILFKIFKKSLFLGAKL